MVAYNKQIFISNFIKVFYLTSLSVIFIVMSISNEITRYTTKLTLKNHYLGINNHGYFVSVTNSPTSPV